jgi:hypothetical protein
MNLQDLKKEMPFKWRVQSTSEYGSNCVAYIDARDVQDILDDVVGAANWQVKYEEYKGNLFASIGINCEADVLQKVSGLYITEKTGWVWKSDCGTESQVEKQKGEASDAFKRAAVMWGVGRFLYSLEIIKIKEVIKAGNKYHPAHNGQRIWNINEHCNKIHKSSKVKRNEALTIDKFEKAKLFTADQIQQVLDTFRMSSDQRKDLTKLL